MTDPALWFVVVTYRAYYTYYYYIIIYIQFLLHPVFVKYLVQTHHTSVFLPPTILLNRFIKAYRYLLHHIFFILLPNASPDIPTLLKSGLIIFIKLPCTRSFMKAFQNNFGWNPETKCGWKCLLCLMYTERFKKHSRSNTVHQKNKYPVASHVTLLTYYC